MHLEAFLNKIGIGFYGFSDNIILFLGTLCNKETSDPAADRTQKRPESTGKPGVRYKAKSEISSEKTQVTIDILTVVSSTQICQRNRFQPLFCIFGERLCPAGCTFTVSAYLDAVLRGFIHKDTDNDSPVIFSESISTRIPVDIEITIDSLFLCIHVRGKIFIKTLFGTHAFSPVTQENTDIRIILF